MTMQCIIAQPVVFRPILFLILNSTDVCRHPHDAVLSQGKPRDAAVNFDTYRILQRRRAVSLPLRDFLVYLYTCRPILVQ